MAEPFREYLQRLVDNGELMSTAQVASMFDTTVNTVSGWCRSGELSAVKLPQPGEHHHAAEWIVVYDDLLKFRAKRPDFAKSFKERCRAWNDFIEGGCIRELGHTGLHRSGKGRAVTWKNSDPGSHK